MKFSFKDFFSKCDQTRSFLLIWSHYWRNSYWKISFFVQCLHYKLYEALLSKYETTTLLQHLQNSCLQTEYRTAATVWGLMMKITNTRKTLFFSRKNQLGQIVYWNKVIVQRQMLQQLVYLISVCKKSY